MTYSDAAQRHQFSFAVGTPLSPSQAFERVTTWSDHAAPGTTITVHTAEGSGVGARFTARTGLGPIGFDDHMKVVGWRAPDAGTSGTCRISKTGPLLGGFATIEVFDAQMQVPTDPERPGASVQWTESVYVDHALVAEASAALFALIGPFVFKPLVSALVAPNA